jgi:hypothetical protein
MDRYAHINDSGEVVNISIWDGVTEFNPKGVVLVQDDGDARIGGRWDGNSFEYTEPTPPEPTPEQVALQAKKDSAREKLVALGISPEELSALFGV